jgi:predicted MPP superfamily phosphohydrolase
VLLGLVDLGRGLYHLGVWVSSLFGHQALPVDPARRTATARLLAEAVTVLALGLGGLALIGAARAPRVRELRVALPRFPQELADTVLVQITDLHLGPTLQREFLEDVVRRTNALRPDVIAITGDVADGSVTSLREMVAPLGELHARWGVFFVTGNHEYYAGADAWCAEFRRLGIRTLHGERVTVGDGRHGFDLAGVDDLEARRFTGGAGTDLGATLAGRDPSRALVLLAHQPRVVFDAQQYGVDLQLSGHTHGGQFWPWVLMVRLQQPVVSGLRRFGDTFVYASNGTGYWGPPMRLGVPAEITKVVLTHGEGAPRAERLP